MTDPDIILYLYPNDGPGYGDASLAIVMPENESRRAPPRRRDSSGTHRILSRQDRESTELPEEYRSIEDRPCIVFRFSDGARTRYGVVAGTGANVDFRLPKQPGISRSHLAFTFDDQNRPIARDLGSTCGTRMSYDGVETERRSNFDWLLQGPNMLNQRPLVLIITSKVQFKVVVPSRDITAPDYMERVAQFRQGTGDPGNLLASLVLLSAPGTQPTTGTHTPISRPGPVLYKKHLGSGAFGRVTYIWNATTGEEYVEKEPLEKLIRTGNVNMKNWKNEARIMSKVSHNHIVAFRDATFSPRPRLIFEYIPGGSLATCSNLSTFENTQVLLQSLSAVEYLHMQKPPIVHRDLKPDNMLVLYRYSKSGGIYIKFADFGFARAAAELKTFCGTLLWAAPEIYTMVPIPRAKIKYSVAVDIWCLGAVVASLECGLPKYKESYGESAVGWIDALVEHVKRYQKLGNKLLSFVLDNMLVVDPAARKDALYCHTEALRLTDCDSRLHFLDLVPGGWRDESADEVDDESEDEDASRTPKASALVIQSSIESEGAGEASTIRLQPQRDDSQIPGGSTIATITPSLINDIAYRDSSFVNSLVNPTDSGRSQSAVAPTPDPQLHPEQEGSIVELQADHESEEDIDISLLVRRHQGGAIDGNAVEQVVENLDAPTRAVGLLRRKRIWPDDRSPLVPVCQYVTVSSAGTAPEVSFGMELRGGKRYKVQS
ncbi:MAG: hypothetical protein M1817_000834 [Caeruleum heppii]|nr:MAG: hypothetical protein M1817_000834 [Caeruleum heppii]